MRSNPDGAAALCRLVRRRGHAEETLLLLEALCQRVPCGHRLSRTREGPNWPQELWECPSCGADGQETTEHILLCEATEEVRRSAVEIAIREAGLPRDNTELHENPTRFAQQSSTSTEHGPVRHNSPAVRLPPHWTTLMWRELSLNTQIGTSAANRDPHFAHWHSWDTEDHLNGAEGTGWSSPWRGKFVLVTPQREHIESALRRAARSTIL